MKNLLDFICSVFHKGFWVDVFPEHFNEKCFDCNKGVCKGCEHYKGI